MFTGIVEEVGTISKIKSASLVIKADKVLEGTRLGDSIAVNGVCLTVVNIGNNEFEADVMPETKRCSNLSDVKPGDKVNLERAMAANGRFGGHIVSGHIDGEGSILEIKEEGNAFWYAVSAKEEILKYVVRKGSVTIDGISLTVAKVEDDSFYVSIIPHTRKETSLSCKKIGDRVNIECDMVGKYIEHFISFRDRKKESSLNEEFLRKFGYVN
ncbi:MAG: riboflavin synthase [Lachnospiraceae bacterium]|nr:riboflavin synthase [Lachnospiraceae bacterium]